MTRLFKTPKPIKCFCCDLNWAKVEKPVPSVRAAMAADWAKVDAREYFDWHAEFGNNVMFCQAYLFGGTALYPSRLGPVAPGKGAELLPRLYELARKAKMPFMSYFCVGTDCTVAAHCNDWVVPKSRETAHFGFLAPESPWTELLCGRITEFLRQYPVEWLLFDWFVYGTLKLNESKVQPAWFVKQPFHDIICRKMP